MLYSVTVPCHSLYMKQVPGDGYLHTRRIMQKFICIALLYRKYHDCDFFSLNCLASYKITMSSRVLCPHKFAFDIV